MNNTIKFSHDYYKLNVIADKIQGGKHPVTLLEVFVRKSEELSPAFTEYDTTYFDGKLLLSAIALITTKYETSKTPQEVLEKIISRSHLIK